MRRAIAMIELIFAIVVMGLVLMSAPMLLQQAKESTFVSLQQESIAAAASHISIVLSQAWDQGDTNTSLNAPVLIVTNGDSNLEMNASTGKRNGTPRLSNRTFLTPTGGTISASPLSTFGKIDASGDGDGIYNDIDDYSGNDFNLTLIEDANGQGDYIDIGIKINTNVIYSPDSPSGTGTYASGNTIRLDNPFTDTGLSAADTTNIKTISITLTNDVEELNKTIILKAFSCNIGTYRPLERREY